MKKSPRRPLQFSIGGLLAVLTITSLIFGWRANRLINNQTAIRAFQSRGMLVSLHTNDKEIKPEDLSFWGNVNITGIELAKHGPLESYNSVPSLWRNLSKFRPLSSLFIDGMDMTEGGDSYDQTFKNEISDATFSFCRFRGNSLRIAIEEMPRLRSLKLIACNLDADALCQLSFCRKLESLTIYENSLPGDVIANLSRVPLRKLRIANVALGLRIELSDNDIKALTNMHQLEELQIQNVPGFDMSKLRQLKKCSKLRMLTFDIRDAASTDVEAAKVEFEETLPNCELNIRLFTK